MKIGLYGDSTQAAVSVYAGVVYPAVWSPAKILQMMLDHKYGQGVHTVRNYGIGGTTIAGAVGSNMYPQGNVYQHISAMGDDIVVANWGINDAFTPGYTAETHKNHYINLKNHVENSGKIFVFQTPYPINHGHFNIVAALAAAVMTIPGIRVMDVFNQILQFYPAWQSHMSDGIHPNYIMYFWTGDYLFKVIDPMIEQ